MELMKMRKLTIDAVVDDRVVSRLCQKLQQLFGQSPSVRISLPDVVVPNSGTQPAAESCAELPRQYQWVKDLVSI